MKRVPVNLPPLLCHYELEYTALRELIWATCPLLNTHKNLGQQGASRGD